MQQRKFGRIEVNRIIIKELVTTLDNKTLKEFPSLHFVEEGSRKGNKLKSPSE